jgi:hypothetical protein
VAGPRPPRRPRHHLLVGTGRPLGGDSPCTAQRTVRGRVRPRPRLESLGELVRCLPAMP